MEKEGSVDRISELPEGILHHILSFLPTEDVIRTATTCNRLNQVWTTLPFLDFPPLEKPDEDEEVRECDSKREKLNTLVEEEEGNGGLCEILRKREKLFTFIERTLTRRRMQDLTVQKFQLGLTKLDLQLREHLDRWIHYLVNCNIKELRLQISREEAQLYDLPSILSTAPSLCALTLSRCRMPCGSISLPSLRKLHLDSVYLDEKIFIDIISTCRHLEDLNFFRCLGLRNRMHVSESAQSHLKSVTLVPNNAELFDEVLIEAPYLEKFSYSGGGRLCKINVESCVSLNRLALVSANITNTQLYELVLKLPRLELLNLGNLNLDSIEISSCSLKQLILSHVFNNFSEKRFGNITVDTPNLTYLTYAGCLSSKFLKSLAVKEVVLDIDEVLSKGECTAEKLFNNLMQFLRAFDYSGVVVLNCGYFEVLTFPAEMRLNLLAPLAHIDHLVLRGGLKASPFNVLAELLDSLLWICPNLDKLSLENDIYDETYWQGYPIDLFIKFTSELTANQCVCVTFPRRCWRHSISDLKVKLLGADAEVCRNLMYYLTHHGETSKIL